MTAPSITAPTNPRLSRSDRWQPALLLIAVGGGLLLGKLSPAVGDALSVGVSGGVFVLLTLVMLNVRPGGVAAALRQRRFLAAAIGLNFVANPVLAWALTQVFLTEQPELATGLVLFLVTPCIGWYLVFTELAGGDTELGISLLGVNVILQVLLLPLYLKLFVGGATPLELSTLVRSIVIYLVLPAVIATAIRPRRSYELPAAIKGPTLKTLALVVVIVSMFASQSATIYDNPAVFLRLLAPITAFFVISFIVALAVAQRLRLPNPQTALLAFTTTSRNSEASLAIAATAFASPLVGLTVVLGPVIELPLLVVMVQILNRRSKPTHV